MEVDSWYGRVFRNRLSRWFVFGFLGCLWLMKLVIILLVLLKWYNVWLCIVSNNECKGKLLCLVRVCKCDRLLVGMFMWIVVMCWGFFFVRLGNGW